MLERRAAFHAQGVNWSLARRRTVRTCMSSYTSLLGAAQLALAAVKRSSTVLRTGGQCAVAAEVSSLVPQPYIVVWYAAHQRKCWMFFSYSTVQYNDIRVQYCTQLHYPFFPATALAHAFLLRLREDCYVNVACRSPESGRQFVPSLPLRLKQ